MTDDELQALVRKSEERRAARDLKRAGELGKSAAQLGVASFREEARRERLAARRLESMRKEDADARK